MPLSPTVNARAGTMDLEQLPTAAASGQPNSDDTAGQLATWNPVVSGFGHLWHRAVDCPLRLRVDDAVSGIREDDEGWVDG